MGRFGDKLFAFPSVRVFFESCRRCRQVFAKLIDRAKKEKRAISVENARAVARDMFVNEHFYSESKKASVKIVPKDMPQLYEHDANPVQKFIRRVIFAYVGLEKDINHGLPSPRWAQGSEEHRGETRKAAPQMCSESEDDGATADARGGKQNTTGGRQSCRRRS